ncbi:hypothetical protein [Vannielia sp. SX4]|uniref:hypothetical protein n=1 Tax=Vannielia sp. SX4 TaxID=3463852 RepID=UPI00405862DC
MRLTASLKRKIGGGIALAGLGGLFLTGSTFDLFGKPIDPREPAIYVFFACILLGVFGAAFTSLSVRSSLIATFCVGLVFGGVFLLGKRSRGEF